MESYSVEDNGAGIWFNVYYYNVQPNITIDYATGMGSEVSTYGSTTDKPTSTPERSTQPKENTTQHNNSQTVYITKTGKKYHLTKNCSGLNNANAIYDSTLSKVQDKGLTPCSKCY